MFTYMSVLIYNTVYSLLTLLLILQSRSCGSPQLSKRFFNTNNSQTSPPVPPMRTGSSTNSYTSTWLSNQNTDTDQCGNQSVHRLPPPQQHPPPVSDCKVTANK